MNPVLAFLNDNPDYSYDEGIEVLLAFSANRGVNTFIMTRHDKQHLRNELNRLAHIPNLRPLPGKEFPKPQPKQQEPSKVEQEPVARQPEPPKEESDDDDENFVSFADLKRHETYKPEDLPTPLLVDLWTKNRDDYKELQFCHAQMKQANSDAGRAEFRSKVLSLREKITERWKLFDEEMERLTTSNQQGEDDKPFNAGNVRSNISKYLKKDSWTDEQRLKIQHWVESLVNHNEKITEETIAILRERGISI